ncbi:ATP-binding cassette domain-containing protein [Magnetovibrio blakemorei]|uniref:ATP-binding protein Uup n=1 Tax=Magnetovibrio blakemorei TaxID=28181 RepID=A0A1E5Q4G1_9PROT|nr:ATP-binding cassette domain-containing protein [Magnetovibrio blakemorei]OEJ65056.1 elongation factor 3 [Magnetovibrio blakemorei]
MAAPLLTLRDIHLTFGGTPLLEGADLTVAAGERMCLVGRNGCGKSTLLKIAAGLIEPDNGERVLQTGTSVNYLPQEPDLSGFATALEYVEAGLGPHDDLYRAQVLLTDLGLNGQEDPKTLSGGEARRAALARALAPKPDVLLLDEPTNHLDLAVIEWLEQELNALNAALVVISHDRRFLENVSQSSVWIYQGVTHKLPKSFAHFEAWRDETLGQIELDQHKLDRKIVRELHWLQRGVTGRRKRNMGRLRALDQLRQDRRDQMGPTGSVKLTASESGKSGKRVMEAEGISKSYGDNTVVKDFSTRILRGDRLGIVGANGAGKTTLLKMLIGTLEPDSGTVLMGTKIEMASLDQMRDALNPDWTLVDVLTGRNGDSVTVGGQQKHVMGYMQDFLFAPEQANTPVQALSGGERGRLMLARAMTQPANLLVLDEPTNDLDLETLDLLQEMIAEFDGTVILVSHDRDFLDRVATSVIINEGQGRWQEYPGGYSDMVMQRGHGVSARAPVAASQSKRVRSPKQAEAPAEPSKLKLSYKEKFALETLPARMETLSGEIDALQAKMDDPGFYARDPQAFNKLAGKLESKSAELKAAEEQWLTLEMLREEIDNA